MLPPGFEPGITGLRGQYAWPDYTTGAYRNLCISQFKAIAISFHEKLTDITFNCKKL